MEEDGLHSYSGDQCALAYRHQPVSAPSWRGP